MGGNYAINASVDSYYTYTNGSGFYQTIMQANNYPNLTFSIPNPTFQVLNIVVDNKKVSEWASYEVTYQLRLPTIGRNHYINLTVSSAIKKCDPASISLTLACNTSIPSRNMLNSYNYLFQTGCCCDNVANDIMSFNISCLNPESKMPTTDFTLQAQLGNSHSTRYYTSVGAPITLLIANNFSSISLNMLHSWIGRTNKLTVNITKTSPFISTEIDQILFDVSPSLSIETCDATSTVGITPSSPSVSCAGQVITMSGITQLEDNFSVILVGIKNPLGTSDAINITASTWESGYLSEERTTTNQYLSCDYPCMNCETVNLSNCTSCYTENNAVFEGGTSFHILDAVSSSPNTCRNQCPSGFSLNLTDISCFQIRDFEPTTTITILDKTRVQTSAIYAFLLKPQIDLKAEAILEITHPPQIGGNLSCTSTLGDCSVSGSVLTLRNFLTADYVISTSADIYFQIHNMYLNPMCSLTLAELSFLLETKIGGIIYHSGNISISGPAGEIRYNPHTLGSPIISHNSSSTASYTTVTFNITNPNFSIHQNSQMFVTLPDQMSFGGNLPTFNPLENLDAGSMTNTPPYLTITNIFHSQLPANSVIRFSVDNIINPYKLGDADSFKIHIAPPGEILTTGKSPEDLCLQFSRNDDLVIHIDFISQFPSFSVIPDNFLTSNKSIYEVRVIVGDDQMNISDIIQFKVPSTVIDCIFSVPMPNGNSNLTTKLYTFSLDSIAAASSEYKFSVECYNPETTRPTNDFGIWVSHKFGENWFIYYKSSGSPLTMITPNTFQNLGVSMADDRPLVNNTFTFTLTRTANYPSIDINRILIDVPTTMNFTSSRLVGISGFTVGAPTFTKLSSYQLQIDGIIELARLIVFEIIDMQNPPLSTDEIQFNITTCFSNIYLAESAGTNILQTSCNFPCQLCVVGFPENCTLCFPRSSPLFKGVVEKEYIYFNYECLPTCPSHYFENSTTCIPCNAPCNECHTNSFNCTVCYPDKYLLNNRCIDPCPPYYYQNAVDWVCDRNIICIYIYIYKLI